MIATAAKNAIAVEVHDRATGTLRAVALLVAAQRYAAVLTTASPIVERELTVDGWQEVERWVEESDAKLPARPAPLSAVVVAQLIDEQESPVTAQRLASIPNASASTRDAATLARRLLPELLARV